MELQVQLRTHYNLNERAHSLSFFSLAGLVDAFAQWQNKPQKGRRKINHEAHVMSHTQVPDIPPWVLTLREW